MDDPRRAERPPIRDLRYSGRGHPDPAWASSTKPASSPRSSCRALDVVTRFWNWIAKRGIRGRFAISLQACLLGFLASLTLALPLGLLAGAFKPAEALLEPAMDFIRYMPAVAFVPLMMLWCGVGELIEGFDHLHRHLLPDGADVRRRRSQGADGSRSRRRRPWAPRGARSSIR